MSYKLKLSKSKLYALMCDHVKECNLPPLRKCDFHHLGRTYWMYYCHPVSSDLIRVTVTTVLGTPMIRFRNEDEATDFIQEYLTIDSLLKGNMLEEVSG